MIMTILSERIGTPSASAGGVGAAGPETARGPPRQSAGFESESFRFRLYLLL